MQPTDVLLRGRFVDRRPVVLVGLLGVLTIGAALTVPCPLALRIPAVLATIAIIVAALVASRATNVVIRRGPLVYVRDRRSNRLVPLPGRARIVCATTHEPNVLLLDDRGRTLAGASVR